MSKLFYETGKIRRTTTYKAGIINGIRTSYFKNGKISSSQSFKNEMPGKDLKEYFSSGKERPSYPKLKYRVIDRINETGEYTVKFYFSDENNRANFYIGELAEDIYFDEMFVDQLPESKYEGFITYKVMPGMFLMKKIPIIGKLKTKRGNYLVRSMVFNLAIQG